MNKTISALVLLCLLAGCVSSGNESLRQATEQNVSMKIVEGETTKEQIRSWFGSPFKTSFTDGGLEIWTYEWSKAHADAVNYIPLVGLFGGSATGTKKELVILYDENDVVKRFAMSESPIKTKTGLFNR